MTHGVESGPETHQDSAALTYLEGLLMHPVTTGPAATATQRSEPVQNTVENANRVTRVFQLPSRGSPLPDKGRPPSAASQHLKKARLLRSGAWNEDDGQKRSGAVVDANGQRREHYDGSTQGESTLLASLLQSFSSRLQSVALSQHISQSHKSLDRESSESAPVGKETYQSYGTASGRLKSLMRKSKHQKQTVPYCDSPHSSAQPSSSESLSCTERLKAVANIVRTRTSPAPSPKPSVACSQLALLLSSEAHLQQYSREQALKAQLTSRSASERLAAIATQTQDKRQPTPTSDMLSSLNVQNGTLPSKRSPSLSSPTMRPPKERRPFDRQGRPPQNCSSLLLLLLNNHNSQQQLTRNGHLEDEPSRASSLHSDSEYSNQDNSLTKDSSDAESFSSCSPIDLSMKSRGPSQSSEPPSESLVNKWPMVPEATDLETSPDMKSHDKVTLMQLLLDHRRHNKSSDSPGLRPDSIIGNLTTKRIGTPEDSRTLSPLHRHTAAFTSASPSYSFPSPHAQSSPLDLCKSSEKMVEPPFSASKLLQNLAQSGIKNLSPSPPPLHSQIVTSRRQSPELELDKPQALLDRLVVPNKRTKGSSPHKCNQSPSSSTQIENLLEKRTVLQLLLGTAPQKEGTSGHRFERFEVTSGRLEKPQTEASNEPSLECKIKTEPVEENFSSDSSNDGVYHRRRSSQQHSPVAEAQDATKPELCPTETAAKFGLLSQLLKQQNATYHSNPHRNSVKVEPMDFQSPVPKKRKLTECLSSELCQSSGKPEMNGRGLVIPKEEDVVGSPKSKTPLSRESQGFNVLKQLLLSENCLKELSQPRGTSQTPSPFIPQANCAANGNLSPYELSNLPWYPYSLPKTAPTPVDTTLVWAKSSPVASPKPPEGSPGGTFSREERSSQGSPPLTRSNPILYYMLQRGNGQLRAEIQDQGQPAHCVTSAKVEPYNDYEHRIN
ncbi:nuclear receptor-interacting protein 1 [Pimephales promelas]|uniref:nuclear receptor-interacting protein 1 n=1 Tax=Pimephales promelas TaxID=90988 RepID=UPI001955BFFE|nr:nuclear receptor-interacting protein 1 [Pimephales promelas]XP_039531861.1 nuclear receptor-interacting protein 1 [Pimephales promelas]XP_039531863.1 nuclear receptor-interacting protein 1 [Pimephales promelas]